MIPSKPPATLKQKESFSPELNDFIARCLVKDPKDRPTAEDLLSHPFVKTSVATLEKTGGKSPVLAELVRNSMGAIQAFRERDMEEDEEEEGEDNESTDSVSIEHLTCVYSCYYIAACTHLYYLRLLLY